MKNKEKRRILLENGKFRDYTKKRKTAILGNTPEVMFEMDINEDTGEVLGSRLSENYFEMEAEELEECERIRDCKKKQRNKIEEHIQFLFDKTKNDVYFVTFNFTDDALSKRTDTRRQKIRRLLNKVCDDYILNIDYGEQKGREHYHGIIALRTGTYEKYVTRYKQFEHIKIKELDEYNFGNYDLEEIRTDDLSKKKLARYISKLTLHSVKVNQRYVSVKKGSPYQKHKKILADMRETVKTSKGFWRDYNDLLTENQL